MEADVIKLQKDTKKIQKYVSLGCLALAGVSFAIALFFFIVMTFTHFAGNSYTPNS